MRREVDPDIYCPQAALVDEELNRKTEERLARYRAKYEAAKLHEKAMVAMQLQQRQQMMWMAGGTLVAIALSLIWYKRQGSKRKSKHGSKNKDSSLPNDLFLDEDEFNGTEEELQQVFGEAAKVARKFPDGTLDQRDQLMLYGLYKQAREGDRSGDAVSCLDDSPCLEYYQCRGLLTKYILSSAFIMIMLILKYAAIKAECCRLCKV